MSRPVIAIGSCMLHADPQRALFKGKTLLFTEEKMARSVWRAGGLPLGHFEIPEDPEGSDRAWLERCDGLLLQGGADCAPESYGETPMDPKWGGDAIRDAYETRLIRIAESLGLPILGLCRGAQILNVACGGTLYQDIGTQLPGTRVHRDWDRYDENEHSVELEADSWIRGIYEAPRVLVNSVHHQSIKDLAPGFRVTARADDGVIEAIERCEAGRWAVGVQWHPEWLDEGPPQNESRSRGDRIFERWIEHCRSAKARA